MRRLAVAAVLGLCACPLDQALQEYCDEHPGECDDGGATGGGANGGGANGGGANGGGANGGGATGGGATGGGATGGGATGGGAVGGGATGGGSGGGVVTSPGTLRSQHAMVPLSNGRILVAGGVKPGMNGTVAGDYVDNAQLFDPATDTWITVDTGALFHRSKFFGAQLPNAQVLFVGGRAEPTNFLSSTIIGTCTTTSCTLDAGPPMRVKRRGAQVFVVGGLALVANGGEFPTDVYSEAWVDGGFIDVPFDAGVVANKMVCAQLLNGDIVGFGGELGMSGTPTSAAARFNATAGWTVFDGGIPNRNAHRLTVMSSGKFLLSGGVANINATPVNTVLSYDANGVIRESGTMEIQRANHIAVALSNGKALFCGGVTDGPGNVPTAQCGVSFEDAGLAGSFVSMKNARTDFTATVLIDGDVLVIGGGGVAGCVAERYDFVDGGWACIP